MTSQPEIDVNGRCSFFMGELVFFFKVGSLLFIVIAPSSALITGSLRDP
jgi:hypothetical protein